MNLKQNLKKLYTKLTGYSKKPNLLNGQDIIIEGGAGTGKTAYIAEIEKQCTAQNQATIYINATLPVTAWLKDYQLFGKNLDSRIYHLMKTLPAEFTLFLDNAERITTGQKLELALSLMERANRTVVTCCSYKSLNPKLLARLSMAQLISLGAGSHETFDITYFVIAFLIIIVALLGAINLIFLAASLRYIFQGTRIGGNR